MLPHLCHMCLFQTKALRMCCPPYSPPHGAAMGPAHPIRAWGWHVLYMIPSTPGPRPPPPHPPAPLPAGTKRLDIFYIGYSFSFCICISHAPINRAADYFLFKKVAPKDLLTGTSLAQFQILAQQPTDHKSCLQNPLPHWIRNIGVPSRVMWTIASDPLPVGMFKHT